MIDALNLYRDLPALTGSEKQIAWATAIRSDTLDKLLMQRDGLSAKFRTMKATDEQRAAMLDALHETFEALRGETSAKFWIDHRGALADLLVSRTRETARAKLGL